MDVEQLKHKLKEIFGSQITFNKEFNMYSSTIKNIENYLIPWCYDLKQGKVFPTPASRLKEGIVFIKKIGGSNRCVVVRIINGEFTQIHLGDHRYYDDLTKKLGLKKSSKRY